MKILRIGVFSLCALVLMGIAPAKKPNIVFLLIDCWRYDHFTPEVTPNLWRLSQSGVSLDSYHADVGFTRASVAGMLSGKKPELHHRLERVMFENGLSRFGVELSDRSRELYPRSIPSLPSLLRQNGYHTIAITPNPNSGADGGYSGHWDILVEPDPLAGAQAVIDLAARQLNREKPYLLFLHFMDAHTPYNYANITEQEREFMDEYCKTGNDAERAKSLYADGLSAIDTALGAFIPTMDENTIFLITADHGEAFGEDGYYRHGDYRISALHHVPFILIAPKEMPNIKTPSDILPSICAVAGVTYPASHLQVNTQAHSAPSVETTERLKTLGYL